MPDPVIARFAADRRTYIRDHLILAVFASLAVMVVLYLMGNDDAWVAFIAAPLAIAVRGFYLASDDLHAVWELTGSGLSGPGGRHVNLGDIQTVRTLGSATQIVTRGGDKHLMKYMADPRAVAARIDAERRL
jgi:hypothetical protein